MKKLLLSLLALSASVMVVETGRAQTVPNGTYFLSLEIKAARNDGNNMNNITLEFLVDGNTPIVNWAFGDFNKGNYRGPYPAPFTLPAYSKRPARINFRTDRMWKPQFGGRKHDNGESVYTIPGNVPYIERKTLTVADNNAQIILRCTSTLEFTMIPTQIQFYGGNNQRISMSELSWDSDLVIKATKGYHAMVYDWEYLVGGDPNASGAMWEDIPANLMSPGKDEIRLKGSDIFNSIAEFSGSTNEKIFVRIKAPTKQTHELLVLMPTLSAPHFVSAQPAGYDENGRAKVKLTLDRELFDGERIRISGNDDMILASKDKNSIDGANFIILDGLDVGDHIFSIASTLQDPSDPSQSHLLYNSDEDHSISYRVEAPRTIEPWLENSRNVSVYRGHDGEITIGASGGTGSYNAALYKDGASEAIQQISFGTGQYCVFSDLYPGVYEVVVSDTESPVSSRLNPPVTITEPAPPGININVSGRDVSSWGGSDGSITVSVSGGSGAGFTAELYMGGSSTPIRQISLDGSGVFNGLEAGSYRVVVSDDNGTSSNAYVTIAEPSMPVVYHTFTTRDVSCYDGRDGQITVNASGGSGSFIAGLYKTGTAAQLRQITFQTDQDGVFSGLSAGDYQVRVTDSNGIISSRPESSIVISEPDAPLSASVVETIEPLAFESRDGEIIIKVTGGAPTDSGEYDVVLSGEDDLTYSPSSSFTDNAGAMFYRFEGLGRGDYSVTVQDANFSSVDPEYQVLPCSCEAIITFTLNAPPPMIVEIEETASIKWHGATQGELTAHGTGGVPISSDKPYTYVWYKREDGVMQPLQMPGDSIASGLSAGVYQVKITDKNGISKTSVTYTLEEPVPLTVQFTIVQTDCSGASSGSIEAFVSGGVPPYQYQWNIEGATERKVTSLEAGTYMLKVTDSKGGILTSTVDVGSASDLKVEQMVTQPSCLTPGGSIRLKLSGAAPPYSIRWNDMPDASNVDSEGDVAREGLAPGTYKVEIADAKGCRNSLSFTIDEIETFEVSLGDDLVMCRNQSRTVEAVCSTPDVSYEWFFNGTKLSDTGRSIVVDKNGEYGVVASTADGCVAMDQINVEITDDVLDLLMTVPTTIEAGSQIYAVNLSTMAADKINWILPDEATIIESSDTRLVFRIDKEGTYTIAMEGFKGAGASLVTREIEVVGAGKVELPDSPLIKQFWASPNPSTGYFKVMVELSRAEDFKMTLYSPSGAAMDTKEAKGVESRSYEYEIAGTQQGTYLLHLEAKSEKSVLQVEIKR